LLGASPNHVYPALKGLVRGITLYATERSEVLSLAKSRHLGAVAPGYARRITRRHFCVIFLIFGGVICHIGR